MTNILFIGGILNIVDPIIGMQLYKWSWVFLLILAGVIYLAYRYGKWEPFRPLWGMYYAFKASSKAAFIFNRNMHAELISERDAKCIFDYSKWDYENIGTWGVNVPIIGRVLNWIQIKIFYYPCVFLDIDPLHGMLYKFGGVNKDVEIAKKLQNNEWDDSPSVTSGGILIDMILDADSWSVKGSKQHKIIERTAELWNETNPDDQIHSYVKLQRYFNLNIIPIPDGISHRNIVSWSRMDSGCPTNIFGASQAGAKRQEAKNAEDEGNNPFGKYYIPLAVAAFGFAIIILMFRFGAKFFT